jgi:uncharacterized protein (TIGR02117 family)
LQLKLFRIYNFGSAIRAAIGWPALFIGLFMFSAFVGGFIPSNNSWTEPKDGVQIFVETNGVHVSLILPISSTGTDLSDLIRPEHLQDPAFFGTHVMIGWGHKAVYRNAKTWADVRSGDLASAVAGSNETTLHVYHLTNPRPASFRKSFIVRQSELRSIVSHVRATFRTDGQGQSSAHPAYGPDNLFYDSYGHYDAINTCNSWTGRILRKAGIRVGIWTPLAGGVMRWF